MRAGAILPVNWEAEMPEAYRLWRSCKKWEKLFWDGGIANQPHILMMEFTVCERTSDQFDRYASGLPAILAKGK